MAKERHEYSFEDFVSDEDFITWAKYPTATSDTVWGSFLFEHPAKREVVEQAIEAVQQLAITSRKNAPESDVRVIWDKLETTTTRGKVLRPKLFIGWKPWAVAASVLFTLGVSISLATFYTISVPESAYTEQTSGKKESLKEIINETQVELYLDLPDSSKITLKPNSKISYEPLFAGTIREVFLAGEAFFDVRKKPGRPFVVYANGLVTKVLGTSFSVKAFETDEKVIVKVQTGKVAVYSAKNSKSNDPETDGLVLFPNQKVEFGIVEDRFVRTLVEKPTMLAPISELKQFLFRNAPVSAIFEVLQRAYGVELIYDKDLLSNCYLTTTLTNESLFERLDIICAAIEANYKIIDAQIIIMTKGCK
jgi:transmembrane sensor